MASKSEISVRAWLMLLPLLLASASEALGCSRDSTPTARLPGFTDEQADKRVSQLYSDWAVINRHRRVEQMKKEASTIYLGEVRKVVKDNNDFFRTDVTIEPVRAIKGTMPRGLQTLTGYLPDSCDNPVGDGEGAYANEGDLIIVFVGLTNDLWRRNGIDSVKVSHLRNWDLLDEVQTWLDSLPGYKAYEW